MPLHILFHFTYFVINDLSEISHFLLLSRLFTANLDAILNFTHRMYISNIYVILLPQLMFLLQL